MITMHSFVFNELGVNSFVLYDETRDCIIVDPGCDRPAQFDTLKSFIGDHGLNPVKLVNTHGHFDHIAGNARVKREYNIPILMHEADLFLVQNAPEHAGLFGLTIEPVPAPDQFITEQDVLEFGDSSLNILLVPGHSPGSICLYSSRDKLLICGDVLFSGNIGRTDLFGGDYQQLIQGIREKLMILPHDTQVYPGHGPSTTIGREYETNVFVKESE